MGPAAASAVPPHVLEDLYGIPLSEFTGARNARVAALRKSGHTDVAQAVGRLRRPPAPLWVMNQLRHLQPRRLAAFLDAVQDVRRRQLRDPRAAREAIERQRAELDGLVAAAQRHLADTGLRATPTTLRRISHTLLGAAIDPRHAEALRHGRLTTELTAPGFEAFAGVRPGHLKVLPGNKAAPASESRRRHEERRAQAAEARQQRQAQERAREAEERERAARQRAAVEQAGKQVEELALKLAEARGQLSAARRAARGGGSRSRRAPRSTA